MHFSENKKSKFPTLTNRARGTRNSILRRNVSRWYYARRNDHEELGTKSLGHPPLDTVRFGNNPNQFYHTFRHVEEAGIDKQAAEQAIRQDLAGKESSLPQGLIKGRVTVEGRTLEYAAYKLPDGTINVGRITVH